MEAMIRKRVNVYLCYYFSNIFVKGIQHLSDHVLKPTHPECFCSTPACTQAAHKNKTKKPTRKRLRFDLLPVFASCWMMFVLQSNCAVSLGSGPWVFPASSPRPVVLVTLSQTNTKTKMVNSPGFDSHVLKYHISENTYFIIIQSYLKKKNSLKLDQPKTCHWPEDNPGL